MEKSVSVIANTLFEKLPHDVSFYTRDSLVQYGLPAFLVKRVAHHVYLRIIEKMMLPDQNWLDRDSDRVAEAWLELTGAIKEEVRVPADLIKEFLTEAVRDCLELAVYPKKTILKHLFADDKELNISAITERSVSISVNHYLVWSLIRYMEKKEKTVINRTHAESILSKIDEKVVENYHPLNWLALVKPLYELCGPNVPSGLLRLFFEDKKQQPASREFDLMDREISETEFIEVLSSPGLLYVEGYKDDQQTLFQESTDDALEDPLNQKFMNKTDDLPEILPVDDEADIPEPIVTEDDVESALDTEQTAPWDEDEEPDDDEPEDDEKVGEETLASRFIFDDEEDSETEIEPGLDEATTIYDELNLSRREAEPSTLDLFSTPESDSFEVSQHSEPDSHLSDLNDEEEEEDETASGEHETDAEPPLFVDESEFDELGEKGQDETDLPMWRSFLEREDVDSPSSFQFDDSRYDVKGENPDEIEDAENDKTLGETAIDEEEDDKNAQDLTAFDEDSELLDEDGFIAEPIYDLTREDESIDQKIGGLNEWLLDEKDRFIEGIFGDSEDTYEEALADIIAYEDWKSASRYIEKEIFSRNRIDVYDEIAVDFTDRLHSYFLENK